MAGIEPCSAHAPFSTSQRHYLKELFRSRHVQGMTSSWRQIVINILRENPQAFHVICGSRKLKCGSSRHRSLWVRPLSFLELYKKSAHVFSKVRFVLDKYSQRNGNTQNVWRVSHFEFNKSTSNRLGQRCVTYGMLDAHTTHAPSERGPIFFNDLVNFPCTVKFGEQYLKFSWDNCKVLVQMSYVGTLTVAGVGKIWIGKLHHPSYSFSSKNF
jgi:hypothetical protein